MPLQADPRLFFKPVQFHIQLPYLGVQPVRVALRIDWFWSSLAIKQAAGIVQQLLFPLTHLGWMHTKFLGNFIDRLCALDCFQCHFGFLRTGKNLPFVFALVLPLIFQEGIA